MAFSFLSTCNRFWTLWILALCQTVTMARFLDVVAFSFVSHCNRFWTLWIFSFVSNCDSG